MKRTNRSLTRWTSRGGLAHLALFLNQLLPRLILRLRCWRNLPVLPTGADLAIRHTSRWPSPRGTRRGANQQEIGWEASGSASLGTDYLAGCDSTYTEVQAAHSSFDDWRGGWRWRICCHAARCKRTAMSTICPRGLAEVPTPGARLFCSRRRQRRRLHCQPWGEPDAGRPLRAGAIYSNRFGAAAHIKRLETPAALGP